MWRRPNISIHHGTIAVSDLHKSVEFYRSVLGFSEESRFDSVDGRAEAVQLRNGDAYLELTALSTSEKSRVGQPATLSPGMGHIAFYTQNLEQLRSHVVANGARAVSQIVDKHKKYPYFYFEDPDGVRIEIMSDAPLSAYSDVVQLGYL